MGRLRSTVPRSPAPWYRRALVDPAAVRHWLVVALLACTVAAVVTGTVGRADDARRSWGTTRPVLVLTEPVERGHDLAGAVRTVRWPLGLVPEGAISRLRPGSRAAGNLTTGTPLTRAALDTAEADGGWRTVAVPLADAHLPVRAGDHVDAWATRDRSEVADGQTATTRIAVGARVVSVTDRTVVLAIPPTAVARVAEAAAGSSIALVGSP